MGRSTVHYADSETNNILKRLHNKLRPAGTPVERVEYIIELLLLRIFEAKIKQDEIFNPLRKLFSGENYRLLFSHLNSLNGEQILSELNKNIFPFYATILTKAKAVVSGNLPQKMQDQLVLMEEVFANSNFTNNVKGGVIAEVIGLVNEIDEKYILKTDLLGDAIESALSETGGTKDLGLYRTPDHIRKMMVAMVDPDFTDTIYDPACGTAGFLFDAYDYVIEKARQTRKFPADNVATMFYRTGIGGIEYQGRIRKMAAVNMYIRGLNPHNIDQGDSLKMYDPSRDSGSKSVVIANPPFGAERDQPAYPNVWEEYSKESETTILFVKLMFDLLKQGGRCAVVVSEGFLTWGQNSACALRKILLNESYLRAVVSLPQGVFVSKSGQGAKTSILYFEKGGPTDFVWFYKIENDGFSMGTNRKLIEGSQIPELLEIFKEVKQGRKPKDSKYSFCIPKEQIETLDPRVAEKIRKEVTEKTKEKNAKKRDKIVSGLDEKLTKKKISKEMYDEKLWQFDNIVEGQIDNEVAKAIERAHSYSLSLQNYRSNLNEDQIKEWRDTLKSIEARNGSTIENKYKELQQAKSQGALSIIASFDPKNALQIDIVREYLNKQNKQNVEQKELNKLEEILRNGLRYPIVSLKDLIIINAEKIKPAEHPKTEYTILGVSNQNGVFINEVLKGEDIKQAYFKVYKNQFCYNPYRINVGSIGFCGYDIENQIISGAYNIFGCNEAEINPKYLDALFKTNKFLDFVNEKASGGVRMDFKIEYMQEWQIPLPPLEVQNGIVANIEKQKQVIEGAEKIETSFTIQINSDIPDTEVTEIGKICELAYGDPLPEKDRVEGQYPVFGAGNIIGSHNKFLVEGPAIIIGRRGATSGTVMYSDKSCWPIDTAFYIKVKKQNMDLKYLYYALKSFDFFKFQFGGAMPGVNRNDIYAEKISIPPIEVQHQIVEKLDQQIGALEGVRLLKSGAQKRIEEILKEVWGAIES